MSWADVADGHDHRQCRRRLSCVLSSAIAGRMLRDAGIMQPVTETPHPQQPRNLRRRMTKEVVKRPPEMLASRAANSTASAGNLASGASHVASSFLRITTRCCGQAADPWRSVTNPRYFNTTTEESSSVPIRASPHHPPRSAQRSLLSSTLGNLLWRWILCRVETLTACQVSPAGQSHGFGCLVHRGASNAECNGNLQHRQSAVGPQFTQPLAVHLPAAAADNHVSFAHGRSGNRIQCVT